MLCNLILQLLGKKIFFMQYKYSFLWKDSCVKSNILTCKFLLLVHLVHTLPL